MPETTEAYHRIPISSGHEGHRIRTIVISADQGIKALYCGTCKKIVTYLFGTEQWTMARAKRWVKKHREDGMKAIRGERSLDRHVDVVRTAWYDAQPPFAEGMPAPPRRYLQEVYADHVIVDDGQGYWKVPFTIDDEGVVTFAPESEWQTVDREYTALERAAAMLERVSQQIGDAIRPIAAAFGRQPGAGTLARDPLIERLTVALAQRPYLLRTEESGVAPLVNDKGWIKKTVLRTGEWREPAPGQTQPLAISLEHLLTIKASFDEGAYERVSVPIGHGKLFDDMQHATENNTGYVRALEVEPGENGDYRLSAWIEFTDAEVRQKVLEGSIWNCSVMVVPNVTRPDDGRVFPLALKHLALTNYPWVSGLGGFVEELAAEQATVFTLGGMQMGTQTDNRIAELEKAGLTVEQAIVLAGKQQAITQREQDLARREAELASRARQSEIRAVVLALEGKEAREGVMAIAGTRHYPVVVQAVQQALERVPADGMTLRLARDGQTEEVRVDALILAVANAIPKEGRLKLEAPGVLPHRETGGQDPTDEQVDKLATELGL